MSEFLNNYLNELKNMFERKITNRKVNGLLQLATSQAAIKEKGLK